MKTHRKKDFPVGRAYELLEPGPVVLVTSAWRGETNVMTLSWQTPMEFTPALVGCIISNRNHSFEMVRKSKECVINVPSEELAATVVRIGNCSGRDVSKLDAFGLTPVRGKKVKAPLLAECHASLECKLADARLVSTYNFFIFEIVKAHVAPTPRTPRTLHHRGDGTFMIAGPTTRRYRKLFRPGML
jgi:flavin reductase (DIM6/NTAB) family NADH-FMN oxidoreductase RutF